MPLDQQIKQAIEAATAQLAGQFQERLQTLASELGQAASAEHARDLDEAVSRVKAELAAQHETAMERLRAEAAEQRDLAVSMARTEAAEQQESALASLRAELRAQHDAALSALRDEAAAETRAAVAALRSELASQHHSASTQLRNQLAGEHDAALAAALAASAAEAARQHESTLAAVKAEADGRVARAQAEAAELLAHARTEADERLATAQAETDRVGRHLVDARAAERQVELAFAERMSDAVRRLDGARSLIEVLDVLTDAAAREAPRVAILLVRGTKLAGWRAAGFSRDNDPRELEVPVDQAGLLTRAVRSSAAVATSDAVSGDGGSGPFGPLPGSNAAVAIPLRVGGETIGVLYADDVSAREREVPSVWPESVEVLARHACRCLEVVTIARVTQGTAMPSPPPPTSTPRRLTPQPRNFQPGHDDDDDAARRYARLLVSEIKLYHESAVTAGRRDRNLLERLRSEIERARRLYGERVPAAVQARTDYFDLELVRTLANGDASLLGPA
jgi:chemotaxis protein histidine kinase CheA